MKVKSVLLILTNFLTVSLSVNKSETTHQDLGIDSDVILFKDCLHLLKTIRDSNVINYTTNCGYSVTGHYKRSQENVLKYACHVVQSSLLFICKHNIQITKEQLNLDFDNASHICNFNFTSLKNLKIQEYNELENELTDRTQCLKVCTDLHEIRGQCIVLNKVMNFLNSNDDSKNDFKLKKTTQAGVEIPTLGVEISKESKSQKDRNDELLKSVNKTSNVSDNSKTESKVLKPESEMIEIDDKIQNNTQDLPMNSLLPNEAKSVSPVVDPAFDVPKKVTDSLRNDDSLNDFVDAFEPSNDEPEPDRFPDIVNNLEEGNKMPVQKNSFQDFEATINKNEVSGEGFFQAEESHFFFYFLMFSSVVIIGYLAFHNKNKILAYALEGSNTRRNSRRPNPARYRKLESNLEEAISSMPTQAAASSVVY